MGIDDLMTSFSPLIDSPRRPPDTEQVVHQAIAVVIKSIRKFLGVRVDGGLTIVTVVTCRTAGVGNVGIDEPIAVTVGSTDRLRIAIFIFAIAYLGRARIAGRIAVVAVITPTGGTLGTIAVQVSTLGGCRYSRFGFSATCALASHCQRNPARRT